MTKAQLEAMRDGREAKAESLVRIDMPEGWLLKSYEYGWTISKGNEMLFYTSMRGAVESLSAKIVSKSGATSITAIGATVKRLFSELSEIAERLEKAVKND